jgi:all-trans-retinol 13,14-reductase
MLDAIVIGSGMGALSCAAALAKAGHRVLVLEQHHTMGGLTQTFSRSGFRFNVGMHYIGDMGTEDQAARVLDWVSEGGITMASLGPVYDTVHFPDGFQIALSRPEAALKLDLKEKFPSSVGEIDRFFQIFYEAGEAGRAVFAQRSSQWAQEVLPFKPALAHIGMYLGFEGDIQSQGATVCNH